VYLGGSAEISNVSQPLIPGSPKGVLKSGSLFVALDSPIGPIYFAYGKAFDGEAPSSFYFFLGLP
jgi:NTE family protein